MSEPVDDEWFKWVVGMLMLAVSGALGWLSRMVLGDREELSKLRTEIAVLQARPVVDPVQYTEAITQMAASMAALAKELKALNEAQHELRDELRRIATDLDRILQPKGVSR